MSCTVAVEGAEEFVLAADSFWGHEEKSMENADAKVFSLKYQYGKSDTRELLIGTCGRVRLKQLLKYQFAVPDYPYGQEPIHWLTGPFVDSIKDLFEEEDVLKKEDEVAEVYESSFIVGVNGKAFNVSGNFQVTRAAEGYTVIGAGYQYALGALSALKSHKDLLWDKPKLSARRAITAAADHCPTVRLPIKYETLGKQ